MVVAQQLERIIFADIDGQDLFVEETMDYRTYCCAIAALLQKPSRDFPMKQDRERNAEIDIPSW